MVLDDDGYAIPACDILNDELAECGCNDPDFGDPAEWPRWTDGEVWSCEYMPTEADWQDYYEHMERFYIENDLRS